MLTVAAFIFAGVLTGYLIRGKQRLQRINAKMTIWAIYLLLFFLGLLIGHDEYIMQQLPQLGFSALAITLVATGGSLITAWLLWKYGFTRKNKPHER